MRSVVLALVLISVGSATLSVEWVRAGSGSPPCLQVYCEGACPARVPFGPQPVAPAGDAATGRFTFRQAVYISHGAEFRLALFLYDTETGQTTRVNYPGPGERRTPSAVQPPPVPIAIPSAVNHDTDNKGIATGSDQGQYHRVSRFGLEGPPSPSAEMGSSPCIVDCMDKSVGPSALPDPSIQSISNTVADFTGNPELPGISESEHWMLQSSEPTDMSMVGKPIADANNAADNPDQDPLCISSIQSLARIRDYVDAAIGRIRGASPDIRHALKRMLEQVRSRIRLCSQRSERKRTAYDVFFDGIVSFLISDMRALADSLSEIDWPRVRGEYDQAVRLVAETEAAFISVIRERYQGTVRTYQPALPQSDPRYLLRIYAQVVLDVEEGAQLAIRNEVARLGRRIGDHFGIPITTEETESIHPQSAGGPLSSSDVLEPNIDNKTPEAATTDDVRSDTQPVIESVQEAAIPHPSECETNTASAAVSKSKKKRLKRLARNKESKSGSSTPVATEHPAQTDVKPSTDSRFQDSLHQQFCEDAVFAFAGHCMMNLPAARDIISHIKTDISADYVNMAQAARLQERLQAQNMDLVLDVLAASSHAATEQSEICYELFHSLLMLRMGMLAVPQQQPGLDQYYLDGIADTFVDYVLRIRNVIVREVILGAARRYVAQAESAVVVYSGETVDDVTLRYAIGSELVSVVDVLIRESARPLRAMLRNGLAHLPMGPERLLDVLWERFFDRLHESCALKAAATEACAFVCNKVPKKITSMQELSIDDISLLAATKTRMIELCKARDRV